MKKSKIFVTALLLLVFNIKSYTQTIEVKAGVNLSTMLAKDEIEIYSKDYQIMPRILLGATAEFPLSGLFQFETGLLFSSKGYKIDTNYPVPNFEGEYIPIYENVTLNYFEIPVSLKMYSQFKKVQFLFTLGPYIGIGLNEKKNLLEYNPENEKFESKTYRDQMGKDGRWKTFDYGLQAGVGMEINKIIFRLNYSYGLANITQQDSFKSKNRAVGLTLGYKFNLNKTSL